MGDFSHSTLKVWHSLTSLRTNHKPRFHRAPFSLVPVKELVSVCYSEIQPQFQSLQSLTAALLTVNLDPDHPHKYFGENLPQVHWITDVATNFLVS